MGEIYYIDLLRLLRTFKDGIKGVTVYGRIIRQMKYPEVLQPGVLLDDKGLFVEMEVFAVNLTPVLGYLRENGIANKSGIYLANGNLVAYVDKTNIQGVDWYQISGVLRSPARNRDSSCVAMFNFYKKDNKWALNPARVEDLDISTWDMHSLAYSWITESGNNGFVCHPREVKSLARFSAQDVALTSPVLKTSAPVPVVPPEELARQYTGATKSDSFRKEDRQTIKTPNKLYENFEDCLSKADITKKAFVDQLISEYSESSCPDRYLRYMLDGLFMGLKSKPITYAMTGRAVLIKYLDHYRDSSVTYLGARSVGQYLADNFGEVRSYILDHSTVVNAEGKAWEVCKAAFGLTDVFYCGIVGVVLGISADTMQEIGNFCVNNGLSAIKILNENPYLLQFFSSLSYDEIERIALCFGRHTDTSISRYRNTAMLNAFISDPDDGSTIFNCNSLLKANIGVRLTEVKFNKIRQGHPYMADGMVANINSYLRRCQSQDLIYQAAGFRQAGGRAYVQRLSQADIMQAISDYVQTGLGVVQGDYITSSDLLKKELYVFKSMREMGSRTYSYDKAKIAQYIDEYEQIVGFKLEQKQVEAVHLLTNGAFVVAGSAGSGKTTVSNCVVYVLQHLEPYLDIQFAAPTGKAAKRMQEVVHQEVKTLHSRFQLGMGQDTVFTKEEDRVDSSSRVAFFFDEGAMITIDLMYKVLRRIDSKSSRVFLFGDFNQLSPIGKGLPFKNLLRFMPCVFLNVTKRAADGSSITENSNYINENSTPDNWRPLKSGKDFLLMPCRGDAIQGVVRDLCAYYLGKSTDINKLVTHLGLGSLPDVPGLTPDDIQVVSPLTKESYSWGATALNGVLQPLFNPTRSYDRTFIYQVTKMSKASKFVVGDRVIHTDKNMYSMQWYGDYKGGRMQKVYGQGICNGEVGKIVGFFQSSDVDFCDEVEPLPDGFEYTDSLRDDRTWHGEDKYFIVVEYYDFIAARNFYILYRAERNLQVQSNEGLVFKGDDVGRLNLFYAGTTHKLQGSQAKLIIFVLDDIRFSGFVTRQMVYTMITRAESLCIGVGSVSNDSGSMLTRARLDIASSDTLTVGELII